MSFARLLSVAVICAIGLVAMAQSQSPLPTPPDRAAVKRMFDP